MSDDGRKRSITDEEIAIIKAMIRRGLGKTEIQSYFTRPERPVNFGRITNIQKGQYGPKVGAATDDELGRFLTSWAETRGASTDDLASTVFDRSSLLPTHPKRLAELFRKDKDAGWVTTVGETDEIECKEGFNVNSKIWRAVAAFANNRGGYILFGVRDNDGRVAGLKNDKFATTDVGKFTEWFRSAMEPMPRFECVLYKVGGANVGVLYVHPTDDWPVIATKNGDGYHESTIYYRYPGQSRPIGAAEFRSKLAERDARARNEARPAVTRALELGPDAGVLDLTSGRVDGKAGSFIIDGNLLEKLKFIREGEFDETGGEPTLKLIGDVYPAIGGATVSQAVPEDITDDDVLLKFLKQEAVPSPLEFVRHGCHTTKTWLPVFYFVHQANFDSVAAAQAVQTEEPSYPNSKKKLLARLGGALCAYRAAGGRVKQIMGEILVGAASFPENISSVITFCNAVCGLTELPTDHGTCLAGLTHCRELVRGDNSQRASAARSYLHRACCRVDELLYAGQET